MMILIDAGPLVALLHRDDQDHARCVAALRKVRTVLTTTWPPLTEAMYLLSFSGQAQDALLEMVERGALRVLPIDESDIPRVRVLIQKYQDLPMDLADATLVRVAEREGIQEVFTLDRRNFTTYRVGRRAFTIIP
ncbi:MAG: PIN domain-containing protein [Armatimonadetes bacterium]|nr:PIN domain-containing protein [Armatimonadota bacterium]